MEDRQGFLRDHTQALQASTVPQIDQLILRQCLRNSWVNRDKVLTIEQLPGGLSKAPFRWNYLERSFDMEFLGGFVGVAQDQETLTLRPEIGWAVREVPAAE